jgi:oligosaccharide translocation protein RFT1
MVAIRSFSFIVNGVIFRLSTAEEVGIAVRGALLSDTVYFISREMFRKVCLTKPSNGRWRDTVNLVWLGVPIGAFWSICLAYVWLHWLDTVPEQLVHQYDYYIPMVSVSCVLLLSTEVFYIVGQAYMHVAFRVFIDSYAYIQLQVLSIAFIYIDKERVTFFNGVAAVINALIVVAINVVYFYRVVHRDRKKDKEEDIPFEYFSEFLPDVSRSFVVDWDRFALSWSFFKQGILKQLLTEGEKYMITWFSLMSLGEQGVYDIICNLGSIPARLLFSKLEDSGHLYFSQTVARGEKGTSIDEEAEPSKHLQTSLRRLILFCLVVIAFGMSYSQLLLYIFGGEMLSTELSVALLRTHCFYVLFCAVNGITESYAFNAMTTEQVSQYNGLMTAMTLVFLSCIWVLGKFLGPIGFTLANICNLSMRIGQNFWLIYKRHREAKVKPLQGMMPKRSVLLALVVSAVICGLSEHFLYKKGVLWDSVIHLGVGGGMFALCLGTIVANEEQLRVIISRKLKRE